MDHPTSSSSSSTSKWEWSKGRHVWDRFPSSISDKWTCWTERTGRPVVAKPTKNPKPNKNEDHEKERWGPVFVPTSRNGCKNSDKISWMTEFLNTETHTPVLLMNFLPSPRLREVWIWVNTVFITHFPKDRNYEICQRTQITRAPCWRRIGGAVPRAENFGDLITADHKVLNENCESRNNHRYAIVVQDLGTQWIQSYPCKTKTSQETHRSLQKFLEPSRKPKVIYTDNSLEFWQSLRRSFLESLYVDTTQIRNKWDC